jgi:gamma-glutamyltranspeptidase/glutathione hydrolase
MNFDALSYRYTSNRNVIFGKKGMVATGQPLASQAGLDILKKGGNAVDAAIAVAACLTVVEPTANGLGGDAFAIVWLKDKMFGLNSSGPSPRNISLEELKQKGYEEVPKFGFVPVTVPGIPGAWCELSRNFGKLPLSEVLKPAIDYAENGYPVAPGTADAWERSVANYSKCIGDEFKPWFETFTINGRAPHPGEIMKLPHHAKTLRLIACTNGEAFYKGEIAEKIDSFSKLHGGYIRKEDLKAFKPEWVQPISVNYRGYDIWELPPNGQGIVALMALNILKGYEFHERDCAETYHKQLEAIKIAFVDAQEVVADKSNADIRELLSEKYGRERRKMIGSTAIIPEANKKIRNLKGGTVYLCTADEEGNMVSFIQSNYMGFGSGIVVPDTGVALANRGNCFSFDPTHINCVGGGKRPYNTIIPGFITKDDKPIGPFGVMGGFMQPQGHVQVIMNMIDFHMNPQETLDAPRWQWVSDKKVLLEQECPKNLCSELERRDHKVQIELHSGTFGRGEIILKDKNNVLCGGTERRTDGQVAVW